MDIKHMMDEVPTIEMSKLLTLRKNVNKGFPKGSNVMLLEAIDNELMHRLSAPENGWSSGKQGEPRFFRVNGEKRAIVVRLETHGKSKGSYLIEVLGKQLDCYPRHIDRARKIAERELEGHGHLA